MKNFVVLDLETTGLTPKTDRILEIGAVKVVDGEIKERYSTFINPQMEIPRRITELTGITGGYGKGCAAPGGGGARSGGVLPGSAAAWT